MGNEWTRSQAYQKLDTGEVLRMERVNNNRVVMHFATGPERVTTGDLKDEYICLGRWSDYEAGIIVVDKSRIPMIDSLNEVRT